MGTLGLILITLVIGTRVVESYKFIQKVSKVCNKYDWIYVETHENHLLEMLASKDYYQESEWSAYNFMYLKGPSPLSIFFSLKPITIEAQYDNKVLKRLEQYEAI